MPSFMLDREHQSPPEFAARCCSLVRYRLPLLKHCYVLCSEAESQPGATVEAELHAFFFEQAHRLAFEAVGNRNAFIMIYSGSAVRKRLNFHLHVFVVEHRWQKAWVYAVLAVKNFALAVYNWCSRSKRS